MVPAKSVRGGATPSVMRSDWPTAGGSPSSVRLQVFGASFRTSRILTPCRRTRPRTSSPPMMMLLPIGRGQRGGGAERDPRRRRDQVDLDRQAGGGDSAIVAAVASRAVAVRLPSAVRLQAGRRRQDAAGATGAGKRRRPRSRGRRTSSGRGVDPGQAVPERQDLGLQVDVGRRAGRRSSSPRRRSSSPRRSRPSRPAGRPARRPGADCPRPAARSRRAAGDAAWRRVRSGSWRAANASIACTRSMNPPGPVSRVSAICCVEVSAMRPFRCISRVIAKTAT